MLMLLDVEEISYCFIRQSAEGQIPQSNADATPRKSGCLQFVLEWLFLYAYMHVLYGLINKALRLITSKSVRKHSLPHLV